MAKVHGVLLDVDGTLVLSNDAQDQSWVEAFEEHGYDIPFDRIRPLLGMGGDQLVPKVAPGLDAKEGVGKAVSDRRKAIFLESYAPKIAPAPGARELVLRMRDSGLRVIVASSAKPDELDALLKIAGVDELLPERTTSSDAKESKPAPDIVAVGLDKLKIAPDDVLMMGDTPYDVASAGKIGVGTIAVRCGGFSDRDLAHARAIYDDPADLLARYDESPLAR